MFKIINNETNLDDIDGMLISNIRSGGHGNYGAWIARITGVGGEFGFDREFVVKEKDSISGSGKSGHIGFVIDEAGVYEYRNCGTSKRNGRAEVSGFIMVGFGGTAKEITKDRVEGYLNAFAKKRAEKAAETVAQA